MRFLLVACIFLAGVAFIAVGYQAGQATCSKAIAFERDYLRGPAFQLL